MKVRQHWLEFRGASNIREQLVQLTGKMIGDATQHLGERGPALLSLPQ